MQVGAGPGWVVDVVDVEVVLVVEVVGGIVVVVGASVVVVVVGGVAALVQAPATAAMPITIANSAAATDLEGRISLLAIGITCRAQLATHLQNAAQSSSMAAACRRPRHLPGSFLSRAPWTAS